MSKPAWLVLCFALAAFAAATFTDIGKFFL